jgi:hypothetical protein
MKSGNWSLDRWDPSACQWVRVLSAFPSPDHAKRAAKRQDNGDAVHADKQGVFYRITDDGRTDVEYFATLTNFQRADWISIVASMSHERAAQ